MSDPLRILHGPFGRMALLHLDNDMVAHAHRDAHIVFKIGGGEVPFGVRGREHRLGDQSVLAINAWEPHFYRHGPESPAIVLLAFYLNSDWLAKADRRFAHSSHPRFFSRSSMALSLRLRWLRDQLLDALMSYGEIPIEEVERLTLSVFAEILRLAPPRHDLGIAGRFGELAMDARIRLAVSLLSITEHMPPGLDDVADTVSLSRAQFFRLFSRHTGLTPGAFVNMTRMETSLKALGNPRRSIRDIGEQLGFDCPGNFTRFFSSQQGVVPSKYRKALEELRVAA